MGLFDFLKKVINITQEITEEKTYNTTQQKKEKPTEKPIEKQANSEISEEPDTPISFGYKICWLAIKAENPKAVMKALGCENIRACNWNSGMKIIEKSDEVFVTPCLDGYVLAINTEDLSIDENKMAEIATKFEEIQFFQSHRVVDLYLWARFFNGNLNRKYCYLGESGEILFNEGELTKEEEELGLANLPFGELSEVEDWDIFTFPDEQTVVDLAGKWSIDPMLEKFKQEKSTGFICRLKM